jgi:hypothetical protein
MGAMRSTHARFVLAFLASSFATLSLVFALNWVVDPYAVARTGLLPPAAENDRSIKLTLLQELERGPEILILGSSRARVAEPAFLRRLTGRTGFNAGVTGGTAADAWVFTRYADELFSARGRRYVWFVDTAVATNGVNPQLRADPRARRHLGGGGSLTPSNVRAYLGTSATAASLRVLSKCALGRCRTRIRYRPDGSIPRRSLRYLPEHAENLRESVARRIAAIRANPPRGGGHVDPKRYEYFERALAYMNKRGSRPVIVLNPIYPAILAELEKYGFPARTLARKYFRRLRARFDFVLVDCQDIRTWGGSARDFSNATHVNWRNMHRLLRYVVAHDGGALD